MYYFGSEGQECSKAFNVDHLTEEQKATGLFTETPIEDLPFKDGFRCGVFNRNGAPTMEYVSIADQIEDAKKEAQDALMLELIEGGLI